MICSQSYSFSRGSETISMRNAMGLLWWLSGKEFACQCSGYGFNPPE